MKKNHTKSVIPVTYITEFFLFRGYNRKETIREESKMIENKCNYTVTDEKKIEVLVERDAVQINHAILPPGDSLPEHFSNSDVSLIIIGGKLSAQLGDQEAHIYGKGDILDVPFNIKMNISNGGDDILEFFIVKAPHPKNWKN